MKSLVIGMGIGNLYKAVLTNLGHEIITVDSNPAVYADYSFVGHALGDHKFFDTVHICTPNFTHYQLATQVADQAGIVFVEKPGVQNADEWKTLVGERPHTRFMMVKNNQWRDNIEAMRALAACANTIRIDWINNDRVPNPGTWFTTRALAYGGVSRDLMPHLLSIFMELEPGYMQAKQLISNTKQNWQLEELTKTDYGIVKADGVYDVDDYCELAFLHNGCRWELTANWRSLDQDQRQIQFYLGDGVVETIELGLCPEEAYQAMIKDAILNKDNSAFWLDQFLQDYWIHCKVAS